MIESGATVAIAFSLAVIASTISPHPGRRMVPYSLAIAGVVALGLGALRLSPLILALALNLVLSAVWIEAFVRHTRAGSPIGGEPAPS